MRLTVAIAALIGVLAIQGLASQQDKSQPPKSQVPDLGRPTRPTDEQPPFNFGEYFVGKWTFGWDVPEGSLGPSGSIKGTIVYKHIDGPFFEATTSASGAWGPVTIKETIAYRLEGKTVTRWLTDSRGFAYMQVASVGGDLGGYFNIYYDGSPFTYKVHTIKIKNALRLTSPLRYRNVVTVSVDGAPYANYGSSWAERDTTDIRR